MQRMLNNPHPAAHARYLADVAAHPANSYTVDIGNGYTAIIMRNHQGSWNVYIEVPADHFVTKPHPASPGTSYYDYEDAGVLDLSNTEDELMHIAMSGFECTFHKGRRIGLDHCHNWDYAPRGYNGEMATHYTTFEMAMSEAMLMKAAFLHMCNTCGKVPPAVCTHAPAASADPMPCEPAESGGASASGGNASSSGGGGASSSGVPPPVSVASAAPAPALSAPPESTLRTSTSDPV